MAWGFVWCMCLLELFLINSCLSNISNDVTALIRCSHSSCSAKNETNQFYNVRKCYCDEECHIFQDCCPEIVNKPNSLESRKKHKNISVNHWGCGNLSPETKIYMITSCTEKHPLSKLCSRNGINDTDYDYKLDVPVLSSRYKIWYQNIFCAICHKEENYLAPLKLNFKCRGNLTIPQATRIGTYVPREMRWTINGSRNYCKFSSAVDEGNGVVSNETGWFRRCVTMEHKCASNWTDTRTAELCQSYAYFVYKMVGNQRQVFKNPHCAMCNHKAIEELKCWQNYDKRTPASLPSLSIVLDLNLSGLDDKCSDNALYGHSFYDPLHEKCVPVTCSKNSEYKDGDCLPIDSENNDIREKTSKVNLLNYCTLITLSSDEYTNTSEGIQLVLNTSNEIIPSGEYEYMDNGFVRICNKYRLTIPYPSDVFKGYISTVCLSLSIICLILHDIIFFLLPNLQNLPAKNLLALTSSLLLAQTIFLTGVYPLSEVSHEVCIGIAVLIHYFFLSAFFWMNVMSIDIWKTFSGRRLSLGSHNSHWRYAVYAWGSPAFIVLISVVSDNIPTFPSDYKPHYALHKMTCWFGSPTGLLIFFTVPMFVLITVNIILFAITIFKIFETKANVQFIKKKTKAEFLQASQKHNVQGNDDQVVIRTTGNSGGISGRRDKIRFFLYVKLFTIMGLTWISGMIAIFAHIEALWYAFVLLNGLQGAFIFFMFDFKKRIGSMLWERLIGHLVTRPKFFSTSNTSTRDRNTQSTRVSDVDNRPNSSTNEEPNARISTSEEMKSFQKTLNPEEEPLRKRSTLHQIIEIGSPVTANLKEVGRNMNNIRECCGVVK